MRRKKVKEKNSNTDIKCFHLVFQRCFLIPIGGQKVTFKKKKGKTTSKKRQEIK